MYSSKSILRIELNLKILFFLKETLTGGHLQALFPQFMIIIVLKLLLIIAFVWRLIINDFLYVGVNKFFQINKFNSKCKPDVHVHWFA